MAASSRAVRNSCAYYLPEELERLEVIADELLIPKSVILRTGLQLILDQLVDPDTRTQMMPRLRANYRKTTRGSSQSSKPRPPRAVAKEPETKQP